MYGNRKDSCPFLYAIKTPELKKSNFQVRIPIIAGLPSDVPQCTVPFAPITVAFGWACDIFVPSH